MKQEGNIWVAESKADFSGWEIICIMPAFKPGVKRVACRHVPPGGPSKETPAEFRLVFSKDEHIPTEFRKVAV